MAMTEVSPVQQRRGSPERVKAFADGVFAIIITILVLEIGVPPNLTESSLVEAFDEVGPELAAWVISFLITGMYWAWHRDMFNQVRYVDSTAVWLNLLFLLPAALIPFAASVLGEYHGEAVGLHVYGLVLTATALMRWLLYAYVMRRPVLLWNKPTQKARRLGGLLALAPVAAYLVAMLVAGAAPTLSLLIYLAVPMLYLLLVLVLRRHPATKTEAEDFG